MRKFHVITLNQQLQLSTAKPVLIRSSKFTRQIFTNKKQKKDTDINWIDYRVLIKIGLPANFGGPCNNCPLTNRMPMACTTSISIK